MKIGQFCARSDKWNSEEKIVKRVITCRRCNNNTYQTVQNPHRNAIKELKRKRI